MSLKKKKKLTEERKREICNLIKYHLVSVGQSSMEELCKTFTDISRPTFYRLLKEIRENGDSDAPIIGEARKRVKKIIERNEEIVGKIKDNLPATPSPAIVAEKGGDEIGAQVNFLARLEHLYQDAEKLRNYSMAMGEDGSEKIKNPHFFTISIKQRRDLLETAIHAMQEVYSLERMQQFYNIIIEEVGKVDKNLQKDILKRLREVNNQYGISMGG
jgi:hypothetical protein